MDPVARKILSLLCLSLATLSMIGMIATPLHQSVSGISADRFTDFNGDGFEDLAIGTYREDIGSNNALTDAGAVNIIHGSGIGLSAVFDIGTGTGLADQDWTQNSPNVQSVAISGERFGSSLAAGDFNNDGYSDIVIGVPQEIVATMCCNIGAVNVIYGTDAGLSPTASIPDQVFNQNSPDVQGVSNPEERFGETLAIGDFDNDGYDDLAIGVPGEAVTTTSGTFDNSGAVNVMYGSSEGLSATTAGDGSGNPDQLWTQNTKDIEDIPYQGDSFGSSITVGDFNNDGYDDLAIGVRGEGLSPSENQPVGAVNVIYGSPTGLSATFIPDQFFQQGVNGVNGQAIQGDEYGYAVASGDFDNDGYDDLAVGSPGDLASDMGSVNIVYGSATGLSALSRPDQVWHGDDSGGDDLTGGGSLELGRTLTVGNFNGDDYDDLAVGSPNNGAPTPGTVGEAEAGVVNVVYGSPEGLSITFVPDQFWHQNSPNIEEVASEQEFFGHSLASGDYNADGYDDLAVGVPREDVNNNIVDFAGAVNVIYGSSQGLSATGFGGTGRADQLLTQNSPDVEGVAEEADSLGWSLG